MMQSEIDRNGPGPGASAPARNSRPLRVLMLVPGLAAEGGYALGWHIRGLARALAARSCEVHLVTSGDVGVRLSDIGVCLHGPDRRPPFSAPGRVADVLQEEAALVGAALRAHADAGPFDLVHAHGWTGAAAAHSLKRALKLPMVFTCHRLEQLEPENSQPEELAYVREISTWICQEAERVICLSRFVAEEVIQAYRLSPQKVEVCPVAVDADDWESDADLDAFRQLFGAGGGRLITFAGRLTRAKGVEVLAEALPAIAAVVPGARVVIAGQGPAGSWLLRRTQELGVEAEVTCTGYLRGKVLATLVRASDVYVVPSLTEASGQGAAEAMSCGAPVVASAVGGMRELIAQEEDGLLVPPGDARALAATVVRVLYDRELRERLAASGRRRVLAGHVWPKVVDSVLRTYATARQATVAPA